MSQALFGPLDLGDLEPLVVVAAAVGALLWLAAACFVYALRTPPKPPIGRRTLDLGPEPPAVVNLLVHDWRVTDEAVPATLLDLAARRVVEIEERGPNVFYVRLRQAPRSEALTPYERRVLAHLERRASDGVIPAQALTTGPELESGGWWQSFRTEVVSDAKARGLSRDALDSKVFTALIAASAIPAACLWAVWGFATGVTLVAGAAMLLGWIRSRYPQRETPAGLEAASRWLGVRAELAANEVFPTHSPLEVALWDRLLAYGAALGVASGASGPLPLGVESDTRAWTSYGGAWREVRVSYPRYWPPAWGRDPMLTLGVGLAIVVGMGLVLYYFGLSQLGAGAIGIALFAAACVGIVLGAAVVVMAATDWGREIEVTGPLLRLRAFGDEDDELRYYAAVDDGSSERIRALRIGREQYERIAQGQTITVRLTPNLGCVRWILREEEVAPAGVG
jgi:Predicted membrane protein (DUF2207)